VLAQHRLERTDRGLHVSAVTRREDPVKLLVQISDHRTILVGETSAPDRPLNPPGERPSSGG